MKILLEKILLEKPVSDKPYDTSNVRNSPRYVSNNKQDVSIFDIVKQAEAIHWCGDIEKLKKKDMTSDELTKWEVTLINFMIKNIKEAPTKLNKEDLKSKAEQYVKELETKKKTKYFTGVTPFEESCCSLVSDDNYSQLFEMFLTEDPDEDGGGFGQSQDEINAAFVEICNLYIKYINELYNGEFPSCENQVEQEASDGEEPEEEVATSKYKSLRTEWYKTYRESTVRSRVFSGEASRLNFSYNAKIKALCNINDRALTLAMSDGKTEDINKVSDAKTKDFDKLHKNLGEQMYASFITNNLNWDEVEKGTKNVFISLLKNFDLSSLTVLQFKYLYNMYASSDISAEEWVEIIKNSNHSLKKLSDNLKATGKKYEATKKGAANKKEQAEIFKKAGKVFKNQFKASEEEIDKIIDKVKKGEK